MSSNPDFAAELQDVLRRCSRDETSFNTLLSYFQHIIHTLTEQQHEHIQATRLLERINASTPAFIYIYDVTTHQIVYVNQMVERVLGFSPAQLQTRDRRAVARLLMPPHTLEQLKHQRDRMMSLKDGDIIHLDSQFWRADGTLGWFQSNYSVFARSNDGSVHQIINVVVDISERKATEDALHRSEALYRTLFTQRHDAVFILGLDGTHVDANQRAAELLGYTHDEVKRLKTEDISAEVPESNRVRDRLLAGEHIPTYRRMFRKKNGDLLPVEVNAELVRGTHGEPLYIQSVVRDITERKRMEDQLRQNEERFRTLSELMSDYAYGIEVNADGSLRRDWILGAFVSITGYNLDEFDQKGGWANLIHPADMRLAHGRFQRLMAREDDTSEFRIVTKSGEVRWIRDYAHPIWDDQQQRVVFILGAAEDITERKQAEQQSLDLRVEREKMRLLSDFVRDTSHDLRTPLSIISASAYLARRVQDEDRRHYHLDKIEAQVTRLTETIDALHTMARLDSPKALNLRNLYVTHVVHDAISAIQPHILRRSQRLSVSLNETTIQITGDAYYLQVAISALLENANMYTPMDGEVCVTAFKQDGFAVIEIRDTGIGIPDYELANIFDRFYKVDSARSQNEGGAGLGLSIAQKIIKAHEGTIEVESQVGVGSTFRVLLPLAS